MLPRHSFRGARGDLRALAGRSTRDCASPPPTTTPGSAIPSGSASNCCSTPQRLAPDSLALNHRRDRAGRIGASSSPTRATGERYRRDGQGHRQRHRRLARRDRCALDGSEQPPAPLVGGTKGSHLILDHPELLTGARRPHDLSSRMPTAGSASCFPISARCWSARPTSASSEAGRVRCETTRSTTSSKSLRLRLPRHRGPRRGQSSTRYSGVRPLPRSDARLHRQHLARPFRAAASPATSRSSAWSAANGRPSAPSPSRRPIRCWPNSARERTSRHADRCRSAAASAFPRRRRPTRWRRSRARVRRSAATAPPHLVDRYGTGAARRPRLLPRARPTTAARRQCRTHRGRDRLSRPA